MVHRFDSCKNLNSFLVKRTSLKDDSDDDSFNNLRVSTKSCSKNKQNVEEQKNSLNKSENTMPMV